MLEAESQPAELPSVAAGTKEEMLKRPEVLEKKNAPLKKLVANQALDLCSTRPG